MKENIEEFIEKIKELEEEIEQPFKDMVSFINKHKRLLVTIGIVYLVLNYLFKEE